MIDPVTPMLLVIIPAIIFCWHLNRIRGSLDTRIFISIVVPIAVIVEFIGVSSGAYEYIWNNIILNSIFVGFGWIVNIYPNMHIAMATVGGRKYYETEYFSPKERLIISILAATFAVMYDLFLDPIAVHLGIWTWHMGGPWYGVPISNFVGWWLIAFSSVYTYLLLTYNQRKYSAYLIPAFILADLAFILLGLGLTGIVLYNR